VKQLEFVILGAGPTGIGAALRLLELGQTDFLLIDAASQPGGLASSVTDSKGFTWDLGGHIQFSHYQKFDEYMDLAFPADEWLWHERESWVWLKDRFIPYPFQNNLHRLTPEERWRAVEGLIAAQTQKPIQYPRHFREWILATFGPGIADLFMLPYNLKVWGHPLDQMDYRWVGERVAVPSLSEALRSICLGEDQVSWGPNRRFRFPLRGGTGAIWRSLGHRIPDKNLKMPSRVRQVAANRRTLTLESGEEIRYRHLINTAPLDWICRAIGHTELAQRTAQLKSSTVHVIGIGLEGSPPEAIQKMCWMYFAGADSSFYRVTLFSRYSPHNVPEPGRNWSLMAEVAETEHLPRDSARMVDEVAAQMIAIGLIPDPAAIVSRWHKILTPGYPTPSLDRDSILNGALPALELLNIYSRGRFGAWKYEVSNQDHSFMQGVEVVDRLILGRSEPTLLQPGKINLSYNSFPHSESEAA
jgi:protoporphyrinogen oxidase